MTTERRKLLPQTDPLSKTHSQTGMMTNCGLEQFFSFNSLLFILENDKREDKKPFFCWWWWQNQCNCTCIPVLKLYVLIFCTICIQNWVEFENRNEVGEEDQSRINDDGGGDSTFSRAINPHLFPFHSHFIYEIVLVSLFLLLLLCW